LFHGSNTIANGSYGVSRLAKDARKTGHPQRGISTFNSFDLSKNSLRTESYRQLVSKVTRAHTAHIYLHAIGANILVSWILAQFLPFQDHNIGHSHLIALVIFLRGCF
jgi:hypothetical protein